MAYTASTPFGSTSQYNYIAPSDTLLYCFSPYYIEIETELAGQLVTIVSGTFTAQRYSNASKKCKFDISELMQNYFKDIEFGQILPADSGVYTNASTKLMRREKSIDVKVADDTYEDWLTLTYDIVWGALQIGEIEKYEETIFSFTNNSETLPLTITQKTGNSYRDEEKLYTEDDTYGKDIHLDKYIDNIDINKLFLTEKTVGFSYSLGDVLSDGIVAYILQEGDIGYDPLVQKGLIVSLQDYPTKARWSNAPTTELYSLDIGSGKENSDRIIVLSSPLHDIVGGKNYAAYIAENYGIGWYLPSYYELDKIRTNKQYIGNLVSDGYYWSSSKLDGTSFIRAIKMDETILTTRNLNYSTSCYIRPVRSFANTDTEIIKKIYNIKKLSYCDGGVYLRWITKGEYKYFYFSEGVTVDELKDGNNITNNVWSLESINNEIKGNIRLKNKSGNQTYQCGVLSATYEQQLHLIGLQRAVQVWMLENDNWVEVKVESEPIQIDRFRSNKEVNITVIKPSLFIESL